MTNKDIYFHYKYFKSIYNGLEKSNCNQENNSNEYYEIIEHMKNIYYEDKEWVESNVDIIFAYAKSDKEKCIDNIIELQKDLNEKLVENDEFYLNDENSIDFKKDILSEEVIDIIIIKGLIIKKIQEYIDKRKKSYEFLNIDIDYNTELENQIEKNTKMCIDKGFREMCKRENFDYYYKYLREKNEQEKCKEHLQKLKKEEEKQIEKIEKYEKAIWGKVIYDNSKEVYDISQELKNDILEWKARKIEIEGEIDFNILREITKYNTSKKSKINKINNFINNKFKDKIYNNYISTVVAKRMDIIIEEFYFFETHDAVEKYIAQYLENVENLKKTSNGELAEIENKPPKNRRKKKDSQKTIKQVIEMYEEYICLNNKIKILEECLESYVLEEDVNINSDLDSVIKKIIEVKKHILEKEHKMYQIEQNCEDETINNMIKEYKETDYKNIYFDSELIIEELRLLHSFNDFKDVKENNNNREFQYHLNIVADIINKIMNNLLEIQYSDYHDQLLNKIRNIFTNFDLIFRKEYDENIKGILEDIEDIELEKAQLNFDKFIKKVKENEEFNYNHNQLEEYLIELGEIRKIFERYFEKVNRENNNFSFDKINKITINEFMNNIFQLKVLLDSYKEINSNKKEVNKKMKDYFWNLRTELKEYENDIKNSGFEGYITMKEKQYSK